MGEARISQLAEGGRGPYLHECGRGPYLLVVHCTFVWYEVLWGNSLSFVLTVFNFDFRYLFVEGEGAGAVAIHHTHALLSASRDPPGKLYSDTLMFYKNVSRHAVSFVK